MKRISSIRVMQTLAVLVFMTFMGMSASAQNYLPPAAAIDKIDQTLPSLTNPTPPAPNGTLQSATNSAPSSKVTTSMSLTILKIDYLKDVKDQLKADPNLTTGGAIENTKTWMTAQLNGRPTTNLDLTYNWVKNLLQ